MATQDTRDRVADEARRLFNEHGTAAVSTNHIARAAGISPGNLYYHFRNKEEIIRAIFARIDAHWAASNSLPADRMPALADVRATVHEVYAGLWHYRFFYRELGALTRRDPELAARFRLLRERGVEGTGELLEAFSDAGVLIIPDDGATLPRLATTLMLVSEFWLAFAEAGSETPDDDPTGEGVELMMQILAPYAAGHGTTNGTDRQLAGLAGNESRRDAPAVDEMGATR